MQRKVGYASFVHHSVEANRTAGVFEDPLNAHWTHGFTFQLDGDVYEAYSRRTEMVQFDPWLHALTSELLDEAVRIAYEQGYEDGREGGNVCDCFDYGDE